MHQSSRDRRSSRRHSERERNHGALQAAVSSEFEGSGARTHQYVAVPSRGGKSLSSIAGAFSQPAARRGAESKEQHRAHSHKHHIKARHDGNPRQSDDRPGASRKRWAGEGPVKQGSCESPAAALAMSERDESAPRPKRARNEGTRSTQPPRGAQGAVSTERVPRNLPSVSSPDTSPRLMECGLRALLRLFAVTPGQRRIAYDIVRDMNHAVAKLGVVARLYGSFTTGLVVPTSDMDFAIVPSNSAQAHLVIGSCPTSGAQDEQAGGTFGDDRASASSSTSHGDSDTSPGDDEVDDGGWGRKSPSGSRRPRARGPTPGGSSAVVEMLRRLSSTALLSRRDRVGAFSVGLRGISDALRSSYNFSRIQCIAHAKVPIVKSVHRSSTKVDVSFSTDGLRTSKYLCAQFREPGNELARGVIALVKSLLASWTLDDPSVGGLGSFPVSIMVLWFLQVEATEARYSLALRSTYSFCFVGFLKYYSEVFDFKRCGINYRQKCLFPKPAIAELCVMNPVDPSSNCAKAATLFALKIVPRFRAAYLAFMEVLEHANSQQHLRHTLASQCGVSLDKCGGWPALERALHVELSADPDCQATSSGSPSLSTGSPLSPTVGEPSQHAWDRGSNMYIGSVLL